MLPRLTPVLGPCWALSCGSIRSAPIVAALAHSEAMSSCNGKIRPNRRRALTTSSSFDADNPRSSRDALDTLHSSTSDTGSRDGDQGPLEPSLFGGSPNDLGVTRTHSSRHKEASTSRPLSTSKRRSWPLPPDYRRRFITRLGLKLGVQDDDLSGWYRVTKSEFRRVGGTTALAYFENSLPALLKGIFSEHPWDDSKFRVSKTRSQRSFDNHRKRVIEIGAKLGISPTNLSDWYRVSYTDFVRLGGSSILPYYNSSISTILTSLFPEYEWDLTQFDRKPNNYWESVENQRAFMLDLGKKLGISEDDYHAWTLVTKQTVIRHGGSRLLNLHRSSMRELLTFVFPDHKWKADLED